MKKVIKILGISFSLILVLLLSLPFFFKVDDLRPEIEKKAGEALHAKLHLGKLGLKVFPSLSIFADDVSVTSLDKRFPETFLKGNSFRLEIPFLSLLGAPRVVIKINRPEVFIVKKNQIFNFESFLTSSEKKAEISQDSKTSSPFLLKKIQNASLNLEMTEAKVTYQNGDEKADLFLKELSLKNLSIHAPIEILLASDLQYLKDSMELKGPFDFRGDVVVIPQSQSLNAKFKLKGNFSDMKMKLSSSFEKAERVPLKLSLEGEFKGSDSSLEINPIHFDLDKSDLKLNVKVLGFQNPQVKVDVQSKSLDLSSFMKKNASNSSKGISKGASSGALDESLTSMAPAVEGLGKNPFFQKMKLDMSLNVSSLKTSTGDISNLRFLGNLSSGNFKIAQASLEGYGGRLNLSGFTHLNSQAPAFNYGLKIQNIDLEKLMSAHAPAWKGQLGGRFVAEAQVSGLGLRKDQLAKSLKGSIKGEILKGNTSLQLSKVISALMKQLPQKPDLKGSASENQLKGKFKTLKLESQIVGRKINFKNLEIIYEADEFNLGEMEFKAQGGLSFDKQIDLLGNVFLSPQIVKWPEAIGKSGKIEIPVALSGQIENARADISYTISKMGSRVVQKTLEKELTKGIQNLLKGQKPGDLLKSIFK
jgi:uncharacterized protein involved in outer membrane biogenesis